MKFIDLFAGLGGFHKALHELGHECVFASELIPALQETYKLNWGKDINIQGDIKKIVATDINSIPDHDILCAGFPCQPFSKAGKQLGRKDDRGTLFGLKTNGRTESILMSLPPTVRFEYNYQPRFGTEEYKMQEACLHPRDWINEITEDEKNAWAKRSNSC